jgi:GINS complex subunit 4
MDDTYGDGLSMGGSSFLPAWCPRNFRGVGKADDLVSKPNPNLPVLVYCRRDCGEITLEE